MRKLPILVVLLFSLSLLAHAQEGNDSSPPPEPVPEPEPTPEPAPEPTPEPEPEPIYDADLVDFFPKKVDVGDNQLNLYVENAGNRRLENIVALITGEGISTYEVLPIEELDPEQKSYIIARINAKESGVIQLSIKILDDTFERKLVVRDPAADATAIAQQRDEERRKQRLAAAGSTLANLTAQYDGLEEQFYAKKNQGFDLSGIDLKDAKTYFRDAQASYAKSDVDQTEANLVLLQDELDDLRMLLAGAQKPEQSFGQWIKDNSTFVITFGYILGIIISLFTIIELVKKNKAALAEKIEQKPEAPRTKAAPPAHPPTRAPTRIAPVAIPHPAPPRRPPVPRRAAAPAGKAKSRKQHPVRVKPRARPRPVPKRQPTHSESPSKKYKINKAKPTTQYYVRPADDDV